MVGEVGVGKGWWGRWEWVKGDGGRWDPGVGKGCWGRWGG